MAIGTDRFGNPQAIVGMKDKKGNGFPYGFVEIKGTLYKVEVSNSNKEGVEAWVKITKVTPRAKNNQRRSSL